MADKKTNEILEEQKKARQEFLELKKMQSGEMKAPPKPSEVAIVPKTPKEKWNNFWFQYKWHVIAVTAITVILAVLITQCATRPKYDYEVVYFSYTAALDDQTNKIADYLAQYAEDINGDGEVKIQVINCSFTKSGSDQQYGYTMMTKLQSLIAGDQNAILYITDKDSYEYLNGISEAGSIFQNEPYKFGADFYEKVKTEQFGTLPEGLQLSCRRISDTVLEDKKDAKVSYEAANKLLKKLEGQHNEK